jgi:hypothetical protein
MSEFVLIKNADGDGHRMLRAASIIDVEDMEAGAFVTYNRGDVISTLKTASTAAEVLAAIEGTQQNNGAHWYHVAPGASLGERIHPDAFKPEVAYAKTDSGPKQYAVSVGEGLCICRETSGDNPECPMCHLSPHAMGAQEPFSLPEVGMTLAEYNDLLRAAGRTGGDTGKRFVVRGSGNDWRVYNTRPPGGDDGCDGIFITRERAQEYAEQREREAGRAEQGVT